MVITPKKPYWKALQDRMIGPKCLKRFQLWASIFFSGPQGIGTKWPAEVTLVLRFGVVIAMCSQAKPETNQHSQQFPAISHLFLLFLLIFTWSGWTMNHPCSMNTPWILSLVILQCWKVRGTGHFALVYLRIRTFSHSPCWIWTRNDEVHMLIDVDIPVYPISWYHKWASKTHFLETSVQISFFVCKNWPSLQLWIESTAQKSAIFLDSCSCDLVEHQQFGDGVGAQSNQHQRSRQNYVPNHLHKWPFGTFLDLVQLTNWVE